MRRHFLQQFSIKRTIVKNLEGLQNNPFKFFTGSGLSAQSCNITTDSYKYLYAYFN